MSHRTINHHSNRARVTPRRRRLGMEPLEARRLLASDLGMVREGFIQYFQNLEQKLDESIFQPGAQLPIIGDQLREKFDVVTEKISQAQSIVTQVTIPAMIAEIESRLSLPSGTITARDGDGGTAELSDNVLIFDIATPKINHTISEKLTFDSTLASLGISADFIPQLSVDYQLFASIGVDCSGASAEIFFDTSSPQEFSLDLNATIPGTATGAIGPLFARLTDQGSQLAISYEVDLGTSGTSPRFTPGTPGLTVDSRVVSGTAELNLGLDLRFEDPASNPDVDLGLSTDIVANWEFAGADPDSATATTFGSLSPVQFADAAIDVGSFVSSLLEPVVDRISDTLGPVGDIADALNMKVFNDSRLGAADVTYGELISIVADVGSLFGVPGTSGVGDEIREFLDIFSTLSNLENAISNFTSSGGEIRLGDFTVLNARDASSKASDNISNPVPGDAQNDFTSATSSQGLGNAAKDAGVSFPFLADPIGAAIDLIFGGGTTTLVEYTTEEISVGYEYIQAGGFPIVVVGTLDVDLVVDPITIGFDTAGLANSSLRPIDGLFIDLSQSPEILFQTIGSIAVGVGGGAGSGAAVAFAGVVADVSLTGTVRGQLREPSTISGSTNPGFGDSKLRTFEVEALGEDIACALGISGEVVLSGAIKAKAGARATVPGEVCNKGWLGKVFCKVVDKVVEGVDGITSYANVNVDFNPDTGSFSAGFDAELASLGSRTLLEFANDCRPDGVSADIDEDPKKALAGLATVVSPSELRLNVGPNAGFRNVAQSAITEDYSLQSVVDPDSGLTVLAVSAFGIMQSVFQPGNVQFPVDTLSQLAIIGAAGIGNDRLTVSPAIAARVFYDAGAGEDIVRLGAGDSVVYGGDGNDLIVGGSGNDSLYGDNGNDTIFAGGGNNTVFGGAGNDRLEVATDPAESFLGENHILGGEGSDSIFGGEGNDWLYGESGSDTLDGRGGNNLTDGGEGPDVIRLGSGGGIASGGEGADLFALQLGSGSQQIAGDTGDDVLLLTASENSDDVTVLQNLNGFRILDNITGSEIAASDIPNVLFGLGDGVDALSFFANDGAFAVNFLIDLGNADADIDRISYVATPTDDVVRVSSPDNALVQVDGLSGKLQFVGLNPVVGGDRDSLLLDGMNGDDQLSSDMASNTIAQLQFLGGLGNDRLVGASIANGGAGDDKLVGTEFADQFDGGPGDDTFQTFQGEDEVDGGTGFDTLLISGTPASDEFNVSQPNASIVSASINGTVEVDVIAQTTVEAVRIDSGEGIDNIRIRQGDSLNAVTSLRFELFSVLSSFPEDRLIVEDDAAGDVVVLRQSGDGSRGSFSVGTLAPVVFSGVGYSDVTPKSGITGGTGVDGAGRLVVFKNDSFENNNALPNAHHLGGGRVINVDPVIDPGIIVDGVPADSDWFQLVAAETGTIDVRLLFEQVGTLANGRPGLPGNGNLDLAVFDEDGDLIGQSVTLTDDERLSFPAVQDLVYFIRVSGATGEAINTYDLTIENEPAPAPNVIDLVAASDSGRNNDDNVTQVITAVFDIYLDDDRLNNFLNLGLAADRTDNDTQDENADYGVEVFNNDLSIGFAFLSPNENRWTFTATAGDLQEGDNNFLSAAVWVRDRSRPTSVGRGEFGAVLQVTLDTTTPNAPTLALDPAVTDTGIATDPATLSDRITNQATPGFLGTAEANAIVRLFADAVVSVGVLNGADQPIGATLSSPFDGDEAFANGQYRAISTRNLNGGFVRDGMRQIGATAEDLAGNVSAPRFLDILIDTAPPTVARVDYSTGQTVFVSKPNLTPTPAVGSLLVTFAGGPTAAAGLSSTAVDLGLAADTRNYKLSGDQTGQVLIDNAVIVSSSPTSVVVRIEFAALMLDDRFTLTIDDSISDAAGNVLDGDSTATAPGTPLTVLPSGNGIPGGNFVARFTVDSRPEVGLISQGFVYVDINGNSVFDPEGQDNDATNRDFVMQFGQVSDALFAGNFADAATGIASGFDKLGSYGRFNGTYSFLLDTNDDGVGDFASVMPSQFQVNGIPVAGNFNAARSGDEIGLFDGQAWFLDLNGNNRIDSNERIAASYNGLPIVGDFNGDGSDDLAVYNNDTNSFIFDTNRDGRADFTWNVRDDMQRFAGPSGFTDRPVVGDINLDGIDDIGIWVKGRQGVLPKEAGEFFFWVSDRRDANPANVFDAYSPAPLGNDTYTQFGDESALPIFGNFDPPVASATASTNQRTLTNTRDKFDVNDDGMVTPLDALVVINAISRGVVDAQPSQAARVFAVTEKFLDVDGNYKVAPLDALLVINQISRLLRQPQAEGENEGTQPSFAQAVDLALMQDDDEEDDRYWIDPLFDASVHFIS